MAGWAGGRGAARVLTHRKTLVRKASYREIVVVHKALEQLHAPLKVLKALRKWIVCRICLDAPSAISNKSVFDKALGGAYCTFESYRIEDAVPTHCQYKRAGREEKDEEEEEEEEEEGKRKDGKRHDMRGRMRCGRSSRAS